jgi:allantoicase
MADCWVTIHRSVMERCSAVRINLSDVNTFLDAYLSESQCASDGGFMKTGTAIDVVDELEVKRRRKRGHDQVGQVGGSLNNGIP